MEDEAKGSNYKSCCNSVKMTTVTSESVVNPTESTRNCGTDLENNKGEGGGGGSAGLDQIKSGQLKTSEARSSAEEESFRKKSPLLRFARKVSPLIYKHQ